MYFVQYQPYAQLMLRSHFNENTSRFQTLSHLTDVPHHVRDEVHARRE